MVFELESELGDGLEDSIAVPAFGEVVLEVPVHQLPEGLGRRPTDLLAADNGEGSTERADEDQEDRGSPAGRFPAGRGPKAHPG